MLSIPLQPVNCNSTCAKKISGFPYAPILNEHLLAIKSLQQKSSPEAVLGILIKALLILPVSVVLPSYDSIPPKKLDVSQTPANRTCCQPRLSPRGKKLNLMNVCVSRGVCEGGVCVRALSLARWGDGDAGYKRKVVEHFELVTKSFLNKKSKPNQYSLPYLHLFQAREPPTLLERTFRV